MKKNLSIGVVVPTYQGAHHIQRCLVPLLQSPLQPRILVVDSGSSDNTVDIAKTLGVEIITIKQEAFNHGATREMARQYLNCDIIVMMSQDAYPKTSKMLELLVEPIKNGAAAIAYARQLPHKEANFFAAFLRHFNYPTQSHLRSIKDIAKYESYTFFCSNSCAAYLNSALNDIDGFSRVSFGEDTLAVARLLLHGYSIAYVAEAQVYHSHNSNLRDEFNRYYQIGRLHRQYADLFTLAGKANKQGKLYLQQLSRELWRKYPHLLPYGCMQIFAKWAGYYLGRAAVSGKN